MASQDISSVIKKQIQDYGDKSSLVDVGTVVEAGDGIAQIHGLSNVKYSHDTQGLSHKSPVGLLSLRCAYN